MEPFLSDEIWDAVVDRDLPPNTISIMGADGVPVWFMFLPDDD